MKKFEYLKTVNSTIYQLNELGSIGWELINVIRSNENFSEENRNFRLRIFDTIYIFKREINE